MWGEVGRVRHSTLRLAFQVCAVETQGLLLSVLAVHRVMIPEPCEQQQLMLYSAL